MASIYDDQGLRKEHMGGHGEKFSKNNCMLKFQTGVELKQKCSPSRIIPHTSKEREQKACHM
jgi:hypothetical protein